jgi:hypothetical protein
MKIKIVLCSLLATILVGCGSTPRTGKIVDGNGIVYSEYYENITYLESPNLKVHALETLGKERLPEKYTLSDFDKRFLRTPDAVEAVFEIYITNNSEEKVEVTLGKFRSGGRRGSFEGEQHTVESGKYIKTSPIVSVTSVYKAIKGTYELELLVNGEEVNLTGEINRLRADQLGR